MTAEIAIMNSRGIALAADSAVTIAENRGQARRAKVLPSANKIFALSKKHPVGVMVYGSADFLGTPWETIVKSYRDRLGTKGFSKFGAHCEDFLDYLKSDPEIVSPEREESYLAGSIGGYFKVITKYIRNQVEKEIAEGAVPEKRVAQIAHKAIGAHHAAWSTCSPMEGVDEDTTGSVRAVLRRIFKPVFESVFEQLPISEDDRQKLVEIAEWVTTRRHGTVSPPRSSGIVIAGFGCDDMMPSISFCDIYGRITGVLQMGPRTTEPCDSDTGSIYPFAQIDEVATFMEGINPGYRTRMENDFRTMIQELPSIVLSNAKTIPQVEREQLQAQAESATMKALSEYFQRMNEYRDAQFVSPVLDIVRALNHSELGEMAEALVNLTSFRKRLSMEPETVGGPVDVAMISKGDGFVWIKRKHYFRRELNPQFFARYQDDGA